MKLYIINSSTNKDGVTTYSTNEGEYHEPQITALAHTMGQFNQDLEFNIDALSTGKQLAFCKVFFHPPNTYITTDLTE